MCCWNISNVVLTLIGDIIEGWLLDFLPWQMPYVKQPKYSKGVKKKVLKPWKVEYHKISTHFIEFQYHNKLAEACYLWCGITYIDILWYSMLLWNLKYCDLKWQWHKLNLGTPPK